MTHQELVSELKKLGVLSFRPGQESIVRAILEGRDTLSIMPTGAGKSLCYQLPAIMFQGITIVVSPLIALMHDQVMSLCKKGIPAAYINSTLTPAQMETAMRRAYNGAYKIIYVAPERLFTHAFRQFATTQDISLLVIDEAHCVSQWGYAFRKAYQFIPWFVSTLKNRPIISAFTATATEEIQKDITTMLQLNAPVVTVSGFDRPNLYFDVKQPKDKMDWLKQYVKANGDKCGLIYCRYRKTTAAIAEMLSEEGIDAAHYHAGLEPDERRKVLDDFLSGKYQVIASTTAFGMGIDKPDIRYVVHFDMPLSLEDYYQQAGRAGRDGLPAECVLLYCKNDMSKNKRLIAESYAQADGRIRPNLRYRDRHRLKMMQNYALCETCLRNELLGYFGEMPKSSNCGNCGKCSSKN